MARSRAYHSLLEQSRRHWRWLAVALGAILLAATAGFLLRTTPEKPPTGATLLRPRERIMVEVLNGTRRQGAARVATRLLRQKGLDVVSLGNAESLSQSTQVLVRRGDPNRARYVAASLGAGQVAVAIDTLRRVDISVILGEDFRPRLPLHP